MTAPETDKQRKFIEKIADVLTIDSPKPMSKREASKWISDHIDDFDYLNSNDELIYALIDDDIYD